MATYLADRVIVFEGSPGIKTQALAYVTFEDLSPMLDVKSLKVIFSFDNLTTVSLLIAAKRRLVISGLIVVFNSRLSFSAGL